MTLHALDTDILTLFQEGDPNVREQVRLRQPHELAITVLTVEEQLSGWYTQIRQSKTPEKLALAYAHLAECVCFLSGMKVLVYDLSAMKRYEELRKLKLHVRKTDLRIAATALEHGAIVVSRNGRDFRQVPGLIVEDWSR